MAYNPHNSTQSGTVAGATNKANSHNIQIGQIKKAFAARYWTITEVYLKGKVSPVPFVRLRWIDEPDRISDWIPLEDHPNLISTVYASRLEDLIGNYTVKVTRTGSSNSKQIGRIVANPTFSEDDYDTELPSSGVKI